MQSDKEKKYGKPKTIRSVTIVSCECNVKSINYVHLEWLKNDFQLLTIAHHYEYQHRAVTSLGPLKALRMIFKNFTLATLSKKKMSSENYFLLQHK